MIVDFRALASDAEINAEICIIGTGPAGIAVAREFFGTSIKVVVLESGGLTFEPESESLNAGESIGLHHVGLTEARRRQFGGAANTWGAVCVELDRSDFVERRWVDGSGWPFSAVELLPFYDRARELFRLARTEYGEADWHSFGMRCAAFEVNALRFSVAPTTPIRNLARAYLKGFRTAPNVHIFLHATVTALEANADGSAIDHVRCRSLEDKRGIVRARTVVLCCGGIENARLLLLSRNSHRRGLGNGHDLVGRYLTDHTFSFSARIEPSTRTALQPFFRTIRRGGSNLRPRLSLPPAEQERAGVLNCMAQIHFEHPANSGYVAAANLRRAIRFRRMPDRVGADVINVLRHTRELAAMAADRYVRGNHPADVASEPVLQCMAEQAPDPSSRVTLSERFDRFGLPLPVIDWRAADVERRTIAFMTESVAREFARLGLGHVRAETWLQDDTTQAWKQHLVEAYHHMGTTRMASTQRTGVVDPHGQVHAVDGLYVAGTSIFPAAGYANPTLTIVALAIRLADRIKNRLGHPVPSSGTQGTLRPEDR